jgi:hypothetical protein
MIVRKVRGKEKVGKVIMSRIEYDICKKLGVSVEDFIREALLMIAKKRRWQWYLNKEKNHG